jgi:elongation of very long chain fatty acids protein 6
VELTDTLFIVLRKQKLITLHWIHHCLTLIYSWYVFADVPATARWMVNMNFMIHSLMYSYYAFRAFRISIPRVINISITSLQILQMFYGLYINFRVIQFKTSDIPCDLSPSVAVTGLSLYSLFFILFVNYFVRSYLLKPKSKSITFSCLNNHKKFDSFNNNDYNSIDRKMQ